MKFETGEGEKDVTVLEAERETLAWECKFVLSCDGEEYSTFLVWDGETLETNRWMKDGKECEPPEWSFDEYFEDDLCDHVPSKDFFTK
jgi:hypothetical protein